MTVAPVNDAARGGADSAQTDEDTAVVIDVLANDFDVDGDPIWPALWDPIAAHGSVTRDDQGRFVYTPAPDWHGTDSFAYRLSDGQVWSELVFVTVEVAPVNDAPVTAP
jgi:hypothetical protein